MAVTSRLCTGASRPCSPAKAVRQAELRPPTARMFISIVAHIEPSANTTAKRVHRRHETVTERQGFPIAQQRMTEITLVHLPSIRSGRAALFCSGAVKDFAGRSSVPVRTTATALPKE
eukprot:5366385-Pleurochrysis_carterae.AAC.3